MCVLLIHYYLVLCLCIFCAVDLFVYLMETVDVWLNMCQLLRKHGTS